MSGCSELSGPSDKTPSVTGTYTLADVGGNRLPATIYEGRTRSMDNAST
jgi:hypothetical protein